MKKIITVLILTIQITQAQIITTVAGNGIKGNNFGEDGAAINMELNNPCDIALDKKGNLYIADADNHRVCKVTKEGIIITIAGTGKAGFSGDNGPANKAELHNPISVALDNLGNIYVLDNGNFVVRKIDTKGIITTIAGDGDVGYDGDGGLAINATFNYPSDIAVDAIGNLYIADYGNFRVRKVKDGIITTVAGKGTFGYTGDGGQATAALLEPSGIALDDQNNLYISDFNNNIIRKVHAKTGIISTIAGTGKTGDAGDKGPSSTALLFSPSGIDIDPKGDIYIPENGESLIRKIDKSGIITTIAGNGKAGFSGDGQSATSAQLNGPTSVAVDDATGNYYIADRNNNRVRKVTVTK